VRDVSRTIPASVFVLWWKRLIELEQEEAASGNPADVGEAGTLLFALHDIGKLNGAIRDSLRDADDSAGPTASFRAVPNPDFDWEVGEIHFPVGHPSVTTDPERVIADIIRVTGITEHDADDTPPMVDRQQRDT
jgi:hypothetical protein